MIRKNVFFILCFFLPFAAYLFSQLMFIPGYENFQSAVFLVLCLLSALFSILTLVSAIRKRKTEKKQAIIKIALTLLIFVPALVVVFLYGVLCLGNYPFAPVFEKTTEVNGSRFYLYRQTCAPPDNMCECNEHLTILYQRRGALPLMKHRCEVNFYVSEIKFEKDSLYLIPANYCDADTAKIFSIPFKK